MSGLMDFSFDAGVRAERERVTRIIRDEIEYPNRYVRQDYREGFDDACEAVLVALRVEDIQPEEPNA